MDDTTSTNNVTYNKAFEVAAFVLGAIAILSISTLFLSIVAGSLAIIFAILSKGSEKKMPTKGKIAFYIGIGSIIISIVLIAGSVYLIFFNQAYRSMINKEYEAVYGISFDEYLDIMKAVATGEADEEMLNKIPFYNNGTGIGIMEGIAPDGTIVEPDKNNNNDINTYDINELINNKLTDL